MYRSAQSYIEYAILMVSVLSIVLLPVLLIFVLIKFLRRQDRPRPRFRD